MHDLDKYMRLGTVIQRLMPASTYILLDDHRIAHRASSFEPPSYCPDFTLTMSGFFNKLENLVDKLPEGVEHARAMAIGT